MASTIAFQAFSKGSNPLSRTKKEEYMKKIALLGLVLLVSSCSKIVSPTLSGEGEGDAGQSVTLTCEVDTQKELCTEFITVTCAKLASCSENQYEQCKGIMEKDSKCFSMDSRVVSKCIQDFASIKCTDNLPESCDVLF